MYIARFEVVSREGRERLIETGRRMMGRYVEIPVERRWGDDSVAPELALKMLGVAYFRREFRDANINLVDLSVTTR